MVPGICPSCGTADQVALHVVQRYAHALWIPVFPLTKKGITRCDHCLQTLEGRAMSENARLVMQSAKGQFKAPVWMFSGLIVIVLLIPLAFWQSGRHYNEVLARLSAPVEGDLYEIHLGARSYSFYKVMRVSADSIHVGLYNYETDKWRGLGSLLDKADGEFSEDLIGYSHADVLAMREDGMILDVRDR